MWVERREFKLSAETKIDSIALHACCAYACVCPVRMNKHSMGLIHRKIVSALTSHVTLSRNAAWMTGRLILSLCWGETRPWLQYSDQHGVLLTWPGMQAASYACFKNIAVMTQGLGSVTPRKQSAALPTKEHSVVWQKFASKATSQRQSLWSFSKVPPLNVFCLQTASPEPGLVAYD